MKPTMSCKYLCEAYHWNLPSSLSSKTLSICKFFPFLCRANQSLVNIDKFRTSSATFCAQHTRCDLKQCLTSILKDRFVFGQRVNGVNQYRCLCTMTSMYSYNTFESSACRPRGDSLVFWDRSCLGGEGGSGGHDCVTHLTLLP